MTSAAILGSCNSSIASRELICASGFLIFISAEHISMVRPCMHLKVSDGALMTAKRVAWEYQHANRAECSR